jgi:hypothetical protein
MQWQNQQRNFYGLIDVLSSIFCIRTSENIKTAEGTATENSTSYISDPKMEYKTGRLLFCVK